MVHTAYQHVPHYPGSGADQSSLRAWLYAASCEANRDSSSSLQVPRRRHRVRRWLALAAGSVLALSLGGGAAGLVRHHLSVTRPAHLASFSSWAPADPAAAMLQCHDHRVELPDAAIVFG